jgi:UDP-N-acetyl-D-mannosaminuronic acid dehydrogenase
MQYIVEPNISILPSEFNTNLVRLEALNKAVIESDILLLLVDHTPFKNINFSIPPSKQIIDTRGVWSNK